MQQRGYKWIADEMEKLDPYTDYADIWKLSTCYYVNDFMMNYLYTSAFTHFILPPYGGETVVKTGKVIKHQDTRADDTLHHFWIWFEHGPNSNETAQSVGDVNKIHAALWKRMPGNFAHDDDFVYAMCWLAVEMHRLRLRVGLAGYTEQQKIAFHKYCYELSKLFVSENGPITDQVPDSFEGMLEFADKYEATNWEHSPEGQLAAEALIDQFANRWFPRGARWIGRSMMLSLLDEPCRRVHRIPTPNRFTIKFFEFGFKSILWAKEKVLPDPKMTTPERHRRKAIAKPTPNDRPHSVHAA
ncbi:hypothetical protein O4328_28600 [Rhodococcus opacus]|uniref:ER-bound oxygenase mpaB/mpaB'/Rubber oxygenase catalytic domain-containing protein n=1 Tax=Rhodococcus opacus TaxID=37919 RepID=A0AAX3YQB1_RHOOP|nr:hypothetical protein [Rhodococcus opacus]MCZ4587601.1 hypothetical protein [Rhodococcus opacus]WLF51403.1 hypothetical protein Q5707_37665 [Rhodococcus opacus]